MPQVRANGIDIEYESFGRDSDPLVLLIMGFAAQLIMWPEALCRGLADKGFESGQGANIFTNVAAGTGRTQDNPAVPAPGGICGRAGPWNFPLTRPSWRRRVKQGLSLILLTLNFFKM